MAIIKVRYKETDQMGVVYYGNYFTWFEIGRNEFFRKLNCPCGELEEKGVFLPVIETRCKYIEPAKFDEEIAIQTKLVELKGVRMELRYEIYRVSDKTLLAEGFTCHAFVDETMKPINFRRKFRSLWDKLQEVVVIEN